MSATPPTTGTSGGDPRPAPHRRPSRRAVALVTAPLIALVILGYVGEALFPALVEDHPVALVMLAPSLRNFGLVTNLLDPWSYYGLALPRVLATDPLYWLLGFWFGDAAITWLERRTRTWGNTLRQVERGFARPRTAYPLLFALPYNFTPLLAGAARLPLGRVVAARGAGILVRLYLVRRVGEAFESPLESVLGWISDNRGPLLVVSVGLVVLSIALERRKGGTEVDSLSHLDDEIEQIEDGDRDGSGSGTDPGAEAPQRRGG